MSLSRLIVQNFRNLNTVDLELSHGFNFLVGENGSGKTSLLEAIFYLGHGRSFKSNVSNRIINYASEDFILHGKIEEAKHSWSVGLQKKRQGDTLLKINGEDGNKIADLAHLLPMQIIMPEGLTLLNGGPSYRRAFLDWGLFHLYANFYSYWTNLKRLLKQRNALLGQVNHYQDLHHWDTELVKLAQIVSEMRADYAEMLRPEIEKTCRFFLPELDISVAFYQGWNKEQQYADILAQGFERDKAIGYTMIGPQKADFRFRANGLPVEDVLSRGQLKLLMCALRLAQGEHLVRQKERQCLFLIDDFASELDPNKRELLTHRLRESQSQVFITAITKEQLQYMDWHNNSADKLFAVKEGNLTLLDSLS
ncbi:DNA replication/repair protein RecF [Phocoenobacter skyensis]|uniref:DNA replication and repair protein RecF n=1 Tax=Phocoenobacter skyensis TaxID=97481 RepID=A0AAJ6NFD5_9PAST|nr:DNA replication/repair protein RecF [Pasteurella skyensis]MDP8078435.1 DNA replication/repair protein RecF [Pasteurella skyensis]MDP8084473.1 DNA replication/repair protein RecF [Pasteurella skyensis]MDP8175735.1 DNA replication/repair protein RecF [Pasteurella skyensis]